MTTLVAAGPRELSLSIDGDPVALLRLGVPGELVPTADSDELLRTRHGSLVVRVRLFEDVEWTSLIVSAENTGGEPVEVPPLGLAVEPVAGWSGWSWTSDVEGFIVLAGPGPAVIAHLRQGFLRATQERPVFAGEPRPDADPLPVGAGAFHLLLPGAIPGGERRQTVLRVGRSTDPDNAAWLLPAWLPSLVEPEGTEIALVTPDQGVVPGPGVESALDDQTLFLRGPGGHHEVALHTVRGIQRLRLSWVPRLEPWLADVAHALRSRRPSAVTSATGAVVAEALVRGAVLDEDAVVDWLEREDWLARGDALGVAAASVVGAHTGDERLLTDAWDAMARLPVTAGFGLVTVKVWLALLGTTGAAPDLATELLRRPAADGLARLELSLLGGGGPPRDAPAIGEVLRRLGGRLPGQPFRLSASDAARLVGILRLCPEGWALRREASVTAEKAAGLLLADYADGLHPSWDGLAWLLVGQLGS